MVFIHKSKLSHFEKNKDDAHLKELSATAAMLQLIDQIQQQGCKVLLEAILLPFANINYVPSLAVKLFTTIISLCQKGHLLLLDEEMIGLGMVWFAHGNQS